VKDIRKKRLNFLQEVYERTGASTRNIVQFEEIFRSMELNKDSAEDILHTLIDMGLIEGRSLGGGIGITSKGIKEVEENQNSSSSSDSNTLNVEGDFHGQVQQGGQNNKQEINIANLEYRKIEEEIIPELNDMIRDPMFSTGEELEYKTEVIETELKSDSPDESKIKSALESIKSILENAAAGIISNAASKDLAEKISLVLNSI